MTGTQDRTTKAQPLSRREREVADLLAAGIGVGDIAKRLKTSASTVSSHIKRIRSKLGLASTLEVATRWAVLKAYPDIEYLSWGAR